MTSFTEEWRPVVGHENDYSISDQCRLRNERTGNILEGWLTSKGYRRFTIKGKGYFGHELGLEAFVGPRPEGLVTRHGPNGISDNSLSNIEWGTQAENVRDRKRDGTNNAPRPRHRGSLNHQAKLSEDEVLCIYAQKGRATQSTLARRHNISPALISLIHRGKKWGHLTSPKSVQGQI